MKITAQEINNVMAKSILGLSGFHSASIDVNQISVKSPSQTGGSSRYNALMQFSTSQWHTRYLQQAGWTRKLRTHLLERVDLSPGERILEVGSGTGAVLATMPASYRAVGLDMDISSLEFSRSHLISSYPLVNANALAMPFKPQSFRLTYCHFLLLWVSNPRKAVAEMARVTQRGGAVIAFAEPDYLSRVDAPAPLDILAQHQNASLRSQGAHIEIGQNLASIFNSTNLVNVHTGTLESPSNSNALEDDPHLEWQVLQNDLVLLHNFSELKDIIGSAREVWHSSDRRTFIPCSYAIGFVP